MEIEKKLTKLEKLKGGIRFSEDIMVMNLAHAIFLIFTQPTYYKLTGEQQCHSHANRSPEDINRILNNYGFKSTVASVKAMMSTLDVHDGWSSYHRFNLFVCPDVRKYVYKVAQWTKFHEYLERKLKNYQL